MNARRVAVLKGGQSLEREVSLRSGSRVEDALEQRGAEVVPIDVDASLVGRLRESQADVAFIALHGRGGEDGTVQEILEIIDIPYTGSGVLAAMRCMDKVLTKHLLTGRGLPTPDFFAFNEVAFKEFGAAETLPAIEARLGFPMVVKPAAQGSALGIRFASSPEDVPEALVAAFSYDDRVLLERHIPGRELAVSLLDEASGAVRALPVVEARPHQGFRFDFEARYEIGKTDYFCPADLPGDAGERAQQLATATYELLGCSGFARVDMIMDADEQLHVLEAQAIPGMTETSLLPQAAEAAGISFGDLAERLVDLAVARRAAPALSARR